MLNFQLICEAVKKNTKMKATLPMSLFYLMRSVVIMEYSVVDKVITDHDGEFFIL